MLTFDDLLQQDEPTPPQHADGAGLVPVRSNQGRETKAVTDTRRAQVLSMYSELRPREEIIAWVERQGYTRATAIQDLGFARAAWKENLPDGETVPEVVSRHINAYYQMYHLALTNHDLREARAMLQSIEKLYGLHTAGLQVNLFQNNTQVNNTQVNLNTDSLSLDDLQQLRALRAKMESGDA